MRLMIIVKTTKDSEAGVMPSEQLLREMGKFNEELANAGVLLAADGLHLPWRTKLISPATRITPSRKSGSRGKAEACPSPLLHPGKVVL